MPSEVIKGSTEDVLSRTLLRWLTYCRWYYVTAWSQTVTIQDFFDAPVVNRDWRVTSVDPELVRFGLLWKLYDLIAEKGLDCLCVQSLILFYSLPTLSLIQEEQLPALLGFKSKKVRSLLAYPLRRSLVHVHL